MARFNLNSYFALDAILRYPTLTQAARSIHLSQPAMSLALKRLREFFSDELVSYDHGRAELTALAIQMQPRIADILLRSREVVEMSRTFDPGTDVRTFTIAAPESTLHFFLPPLIARTVLIAPGIVIEGAALPLTHRPESRIDLFILPEWAADPQQRVYPLFEEHFSCLVHVATAVNGSGTGGYLELDHAALSADQEEQFWPERSSAHNLLRSRSVSARARTLAALPHLVMNRKLAATMTTRHAQEQAAKSALVVTTPAPEAFTPVLLVAQAPRHRADEPAIRWLLAQVESAATAFTPGGRPHLSRK